MSHNRRSTGTDSLTGFAQRDRILHFEMTVCNSKKHISAMVCKLCIKHGHL